MSKMVAFAVRPTVVLMVAAFFPFSANATLMTVSYSEDITAFNWVFQVEDNVLSTESLSSIQEPNSAGERCTEHPDTGCWRVTAAIVDDFEVFEGGSSENVAGIRITGQHRVPGEDPNANNENGGVVFEFETALSDTRALSPTVQELIDDATSPTGVFEIVSGQSRDHMGDVNHPDRYTIFGQQRGGFIGFQFIGNHNTLDQPLPPPDIPGIPAPPTLWLLALGTALFAAGFRRDSGARQVLPLRGTVQNAAS